MLGNALAWSVNVVERAFDAENVVERVENGILGTLTLDLRNA